MWSVDLNEAVTSTNERTHRKKHAQASCAPRLALPKLRTLTINISAVSIVPTTPALIIKALNEPPKAKNIKHNGNITLNNIIQTARVMRERRNSRALSAKLLALLDL